MSEKIVLVGAGGHAKSLIDVIELENKFEIFGLVDNAKNGEVLGYKVLGTDEILKEIKSECANAIVAVGQIKSAKIRISLFNKLKELMSSDVEFIIENSRIRPSASEVFRLCCDNSKIKKLCGFKPKYSL